MVSRERIVKLICRIGRPPIELFLVLAVTSVVLTENVIHLGSGATITALFGVAAATVALVSWHVLRRKNSSQVSGVGSIFLSMLVCVLGAYLFDANLLISATIGLWCSVVFSTFVERFSRKKKSIESS